MKKLLLSLLVAAGMTSIATAQTATLGIRLVEPEGGQIVHKQAVEYKYYVINKSGATLAANSTYGIGFGSLNNQQQYVAFSNQIITKTLAADLADGDSVLATQTFTLELPDGMNTQAAVCMAIYTISGTSGTFQGAFCRVYTLYNTLSEIELAANTVNVFPNPVSSVLNITIDYNKAASVAITDITGRLIENVNFEMNSARVDVRNYNKGVYLYQITNSAGEVVKAGKFTVN